MVEMEEQVVEDHRTVFQVKDWALLCFVLIQEFSFSQWKCIHMKMEEHLICRSHSVCHRFLNWFIMLSWLYQTNGNRFHNNWSLFPWWKRSTFLYHSKILVKFSFAGLAINNHVSVTSISAWSSPSKYCVWIWVSFCGISLWDPEETHVFQTSCFFPCYIKISLAISQDFWKEYCPCSAGQCYGTFYIHKINSGYELLVDCFCS